MKPNKLEFVVFSDLHAHQFTFGSNIISPGIYDRLYDHAHVLDFIKQYCIANKIRVAVFGGDWYHAGQYVDSVTEKVMWKSARDLSMKLKAFLINTGNHDCFFPDSSSCFEPYTAFATVYEDKASSLNVKIANNKYKLRFLPFTMDNKKIRDFFNFSDEYSINIMHLGLNDVKNETGFINKQEKFSSKDLPKKSLLNLFGHYHNFTEIEKNKSYYIGSPLQTNWGDANQTKGFLHVIIENGQVKKVEQIPIPGTLMFYEFDTNMPDIVSLVKEIDACGGFEKCVIKIIANGIPDSIQENIFVVINNAEKRGCDVRYTKVIMRDPVSRRHGVNKNMKDMLSVVGGGVSGVTKLMQEAINNIPNDKTIIENFLGQSVKVKKMILQKELDMITGSSGRSSND